MLTFSNGSGCMKLPNMRDAQKRTSKEIVIKTNEYIVKENLKELGLGKKYYIKWNLVSLITSRK